MYVGVCHGKVEAGLRGGGFGVFVLSSEAFAQHPLTAFLAFLAPHDSLTRNQAVFSECL